MNKKYISIIIFLVLVLTVLFYIIFAYKYRMQEKDKVIQDTAEKKNICESTRRVIISNTFLQFETTASKIEDFIISSNGESQKKKLSDYFSGNNKLVLRYNEDNCSSCIDHSLEALLEYKDAIGIDNILIIATVKNNRKLKAFIDKFENLNIQIINTDSEINLPIEEYNIPYFFMMNKDLKIKMLFVPIKELPDNTARYLDIISERFIAKNIF